MDAQIQQLIELQTEQNQLLKRHLWRFRFSLVALLLLTTATCCGLGFMIYTQQRVTRAVAPLPITTLPTFTSDRPRYQLPAKQVQSRAGDTLQETDSNPFK
jgi:hypothetical protein